MVSIKSIAAILAFSVFSASALPASEAGSPIDTRITRIDIRYCKHINWGKPCQDARIALNECYNIPDAFDDEISSIKNLDKAHGKCTWYQEKYCQGRSYTKDEDSNLSDGNGRFNDYISSVICTDK